MPSSGRNPPPHLQTRSVWTVSAWLAPMVLGPRLPQFCVTPPTLPSPTSARTVLSGFPCQLASIRAGSLKCVDPTLALKACPWHQFLSVSSKHHIDTITILYTLFQFRSSAAICVGSLHSCTWHSSLSICNYWVQFGLYSAALLNNLYWSEVWSSLNPAKTKIVVFGPEINMLDSTCDILFLM